MFEKIMEIIAIGVGLIMGLFFFWMAGVVGQDVITDPFASMGTYITGAGVVVLLITIGVMGIYSVLTEK